LGAAARLVHALKYRGSSPAAAFLARHMVDAIEPGATCLVPVPRTLARRLRFGIDPAVELAGVVAVRTGLPVVRALDAPLWSSRHAGAPRARRTTVAFRRAMPVEGHAVIIDDVVTTGVTAASAMSALAPCEMSVLAATSAGTMDGGAERFPAPGGDVAQGRSGDHIGQVVRTRAPLRTTEPQHSHAALHPLRKEDG
jgi:predicted amidophosphoribosyltransferase